MDLKTIIQLQRLPIFRSAGAIKYLKIKTPSTSLNRGCVGGGTDNKALNKARACAELVSVLTRLSEA